VDADDRVAGVRRQHRHRSVECATTTARGKRASGQLARTAPAEGLTRS
jgi:hypothetical protein